MAEEYVNRTLVLEARTQCTA